MTDPWKKLFRRAVEQLREAAVDKSDWSFGGGTVLKLLFNASRKQGYRHFLPRSAIAFVCVAAFGRCQ
ncbi:MULTISPECIES: hypothetical protein [unclassified Pyramidobacter]|uniref:hypothetical protein n=1 Tax=unclassified Pyramidobacter TaxID=2632171 RepID=UPI0011C399C3|nr:hypothetical protein [Pyramidobacter sp. CG50-2]